MYGEEERDLFILWQWNQTLVGLQYAENAYNFLQLIPLASIESESTPFS